MDGWGDEWIVSSPPAQTPFQGAAGHVESCGRHLLLPVLGDTGVAAAGQAMLSAYTQP